MSIFWFLGMFYSVATVPAWPRFFKSWAQGLTKTTLLRQRTAGKGGKFPKAGTNENPLDRVYEERVLFIGFSQNRENSF